MLATEMTSFLAPKQTIILSSAKKRSELPFSLRIQRYLPFYKLFPPFLIKFGAKIMQPIVEPDRNKEKEIFKSMLNDKDPKFLSRTIGIIVNWNRENYSDKIIHIHGDKDHTLPIKNVNYNYLIKNGSHLMTLTRGNELSTLIQNIITPTPP